MGDHAEHGSVSEGRGGAGDESTGSDSPSDGEEDHVAGSACNAYLYLGEYDKFLASLTDPDDSAFLLFYRGFGEYHQKNFGRVARDFDRADELDPSLYTKIGKALISRKNKTHVSRLRRQRCIPR